MEHRRLAIRGTAALAAVTCVVGLLAAVSMAGPGPVQLVHSADAVVAPSQTSTTDVPVTEAAPPTTLPVTTTVAAPAVAPKVTTTTSLVCRNSTDPRCGPFRWDPDPGPNQPMTVSVRFTPSHPHVGEPVTFFVTADDPDGGWYWGVSQDFGDPKGAVAIDGSSFDPENQPNYCADAKYGPWTPPPKQRQTSTLGNPPERGVSHTYAAPGTYTVRFAFRTDSTACGLHEPYGSFGEESLQVVVQGSTTTTEPG
jgi:hypothetical protein